MRAAGLLPLLGVLACAGGDAKAAVGGGTQTPSPALASPDTAAPEARPLHLARLAEPAPTAFPHDPHLRFDCRRCHAQVAGHERHANLSCRQCHEAPAPTLVGASASDCGTCHHARSQPFGCAHCHAADQRLAVPRPVPLQLRLANQAAEHVVDFPHARHEQAACTECHFRADRTPPAGRCASCHDRHHRPDATCSACHAVPRAGVHSAESHRGCAGEGCHTNPVVTALPLAPAVCLACHPAQAAHERGGDCAGCHNLRPPERAAGKAGAR